MALSPGSLIHIPSPSTRRTNEALSSKALTAAVLLLAMLLSTPVTADEYSDAWGPALGQPLALLDATDHTLAPRNFDNLKGSNGLLLFMNRSTDW